MPVVKGYTELCCTRRSLVCDEQSIGLLPLWQRYSQLSSIIKKYASIQYVDFFAKPVKETDKTKGEELICWFTPNPRSDVEKLSNLAPEDKAFYRNLIKERIDYFVNLCNSLYSEGNAIEAEYLQKALKYTGEIEDFVYCFEDKVVIVMWGMRPRQMEKLADCVWERNVRPAPESYSVRFLIGKKGYTEDPVEIRKLRGTPISKSQIPRVKAVEGWIFLGWNINPENMLVGRDMVFSAKYNMANKETNIISEDNPNVIIPPKSEIKRHNVVFRDFDGNKIAEYLIEHGKRVSSFMVPTLSNEKKRKFVRWDRDPLNTDINEPTSFRPVVKKRCFWWKWILWLLGALLLTALLLFLIHGCHGCSHHNDLGFGFGAGVDMEAESPWLRNSPNNGEGGIYNPNNPYGHVVTPPDYSEILPPEAGALPDIRQRNFIPLPDGRQIVSNVINVVMENEDLSIIDLAVEIKRLYPDEEYKIVYYDDVVKRLQFQVPSYRREEIKAALPGQVLPKYCIFVFDEALFETEYTPSDPDCLSSSALFNAIGATKAWDITRGKRNVKVAIVDNGFNLKHPEFEGRIVKPYNVWTHTPDIFANRPDHGTHVAGIALASINNGKGSCGIAPECSFIPVQVANSRGISTTTSVLDGILYALYQGADVINISVGMSFETTIPHSVQKELQNNHFKEEQRLWSEVSRIARNHNAVIVVAAGNDNILAGIDPLHRPDGFIVVSALDGTGKAVFSNYGDYSDISAPGVDIYSCYGKHRYKRMSGTSMAAPVVSGAIALMKSLDSTITPEQIICILQKTSASVENQIGPLVRIDKALEMVRSGERPTCYENQGIPIPSTGDVQVLLSWDNYNDLDIICTDPYGYIVWYKHREVPSGGILEIDMNCGDYLSIHPIENIYWPTGQAPKGQYKVELLYYGHNSSSQVSTPYRITVKAGTKTEEYRGTIERVKDRITICKFTVI